MTATDSDALREFGEVVTSAVRHAASATAGCAPEDVDLSEVRRLSGGASRHTWLVDARPGGCMIVQRERSGSVGANLPMHAQADLLRSALELGVPVPRVQGAGTDGDSGFVVLEFLEGESVPRRILREPALAKIRGSLGYRAGEILAAVHRIEPENHPALAEVDPLRQMRALLDMLGEPHPAFELGLEWLAEHEPPDRDPVVVHGDFRLGNLLVADTGVTAVLDWELAHLGSPLEDLGWFCGRAWRFGSPLRAGGVGAIEELLDGYVAGGGARPDDSELTWWEAYGTLRWGLICVLQASVHLEGHHRSVELAAIGRRAAECEEDLLELVVGPSDYEPPSAADGVGLTGPHDRPSAVELLDAVREHLEENREKSGGANAFHLRVATNVVAMVAREVALASELEDRRAMHMKRAGVTDEAALAAKIRRVGVPFEATTLEAVRSLVRDKLAVSNPGYWLGDG